MSLNLNFMFLILPLPSVKSKSLILCTGFKSCFDFCSGCGYRCCWVFRQLEILSYQLLEFCRSDGTATVLHWIHIGTVSVNPSSRTSGIGYRCVYFHPTFVTHLLQFPSHWTVCLHDPNHGNDYSVLLLCPEIVV